jgi:hypothetical protein
VTGADFSEVDIDLLADYVGGALDGTPDEAVVTALIADNAAWRAAHSQLSGGVADVTGQLRTLGSVAEPMPADVLARVESALAAATDRSLTPIAASSSGAAAGPAAMEPGTDGAAPDRHLVAVPSRSRGKRGRRLRWAAPVGIAAGVLAFLGFGFQQLSGTDSADTSTAAGSAAEAPQANSAPELGTPPFQQTGTDYRRETLSSVGAVTTMLDQAGPRAAESSRSDSRKAAPEAAASVLLDPLLDRLRAEAALRACLEAITAEHGAGPITPQLIDFARYNGASAVIVQFTAGGESWVWAVGPECGTRGVGADTQASVKVG